MIPLALGLVALVALLAAAGSFSRARVVNTKGLLAWGSALAGLSLAAMLFFTGRPVAAAAALVFLGPLAWSYRQESSGPAPRVLPRMGRAEALTVLGLPATASESEIRAAWVRLMRAVHPDNGGTDWLAARVNQAHDVLVQR